LTVERSRPHKQHFVVKFASISSIGAANEMRGAELTIPAAELPSPPDGSFYQFQLIGLHVVTESGDPLGAIARVLETGANDVYVVERLEGGELLIPAIKDVVKDVDLHGGRMVVDPPPGL
jgi:16S rRNA processing protein RimM